MKAKIIRDANAVLAVETLRDYCNDSVCKKCVFNSNGYCKFKGHGFAPVYWDIPDYYKNEDKMQFRTLIQSEFDGGGR